MRVVPKPNHFKRHPSEWSAKKTNEESRLKGEYKVECKRWSAKGKCRKASADREPTTDANTLGGQRPRADLWATASSADLRFCFYVLLCLWVWVYAIVGLWSCEFVDVWISVLWVCARVCVCVCVCSHVCVCLGAVCFCVIMCDCMFVDLWVCSCSCVDVFRVCLMFVCVCYKDN